jgi:GNAT superfamily N-acetyltransferase
VHRVDGYPPRLADDLHAFMTSPGAIDVWVAEHDGQIVGHIALHTTSSVEVMELASCATGQPAAQLCVIARLLVAPTVRRTGVAQTLLATATHAAHARGLWPVLDVATQFVGAIRLYETAEWVCAGKVTARIPRADPLDEFVFLGPGPPAGRRLP